MYRLTNFGTEINSELKIRLVGRSPKLNIQASDFRGSINVRNLHFAEELRQCLELNV